MPHALQSEGAAIDRGKRHGNAKAESHAQDRLRHGNKTLGIGVDEGDRQSHEGPSNRHRVGGEHQAKGAQGQHRACCQRLLDRQGPRGDGPLGGAFHMFVKVAVSHIIDTTTGAAHEKSAQHKHQQQMPSRKTTTGQPQSTEGRPQQQQPTCRPVKANQVKVERQLRGWALRF